ncbi:hypothetical protein D3C72_1582820 [compost metagenome]
MAAAAIELGTDVEQIVDPVIAERLVGARLLHRPLDDEVEAGRGVPRAQHPLARPKIADAEALPEALALRFPEAVKRRATEVEQNGHGGSRPGA